MPKVQTSHYEKKMREIMEAAKRVCDSKPVYSITMRDIVLESGLSQGGVYKYFPNIDAVFVCILNEAHVNNRVQADIDAILSGDSTSWKKLESMLHYVSQYMDGMVKHNGRIYFELLSLYASEPGRFSAIKDQLTEVSVLGYLRSRLKDLVEDALAEGSFAPIVPLEDLFAFLSVAFNGIAHHLLSAQRLAEAHRLVPTEQTDRLFAVLTASVRALLGGLSSPKSN